MKHGSKTRAYCVKGSGGSSSLHVRRQNLRTYNIFLKQPAFLKNLFIFVLCLSKLNNFLSSNPRFLFLLYLDAIEWPKGLKDLNTRAKQKFFEAALIATSDSGKGLELRPRLDYRKCSSAYRCERRLHMGADAAASLPSI
jgi:hypothetical protein